MKIVYDLIKECIIESGYTKYFQDMPLVQLQDTKEVTLVYSTKEEATTVLEMGNTASVLGEQLYIIYIVTDDLYYNESQNGSMTTNLLALYKRIAGKLPYRGVDSNGVHSVYAVLNPVTSFSGKDDKGRRISEISFKVLWEYRYAS